MKEKDLTSELDRLLVVLCETIEAILEMKEGMKYPDDSPNSDAGDNNPPVSRNKGPKGDLADTPQSGQGHIRVFTSFD